MQCVGAVCVCVGAVFYSSVCDAMTEALFSPCHAYVSPSVYHQQCRYQACRCGNSCLCSALAHYAYVCSQHNVSINFRAHVSECGEYHTHTHTHTHRHIQV